MVVDLGRPRGPEQLRRRRPRRRPAAGAALLAPRAASAGYRAWFESMPTYAGKRDRIYRRLRFGKTMDLFMLDQRQYRDDQPCDDAVVAAAAPSSPQPRDLLGRDADGLGQAASSPRSEGRLEGDRQRGDDDAGQGARRLVLPVRLLAGLPERARGAARATSTDKRIDDVVFVTGDIHTFIAGDVRTAGRRRRAGRARVRRRLDHVAELRRDRPRRRRRRGAPGQRRGPAHRPGRSSTRCAASTPGSTRPTSTTTASGSSR